MTASNFSFRSSSFRKKTLKIKGLSKSFDEKTIFKDVDISISNGDKIALIGKMV